MLPGRSKLFPIALICLSLSSAPVLAESVKSTFKTHDSELKEKSIGERIVFWAETFIGRPYDTDPMGRYVTRQRIVADDALDCMYLTFRAVELALSKTPEEAIENALNLRFFIRGKLDGKQVINYEDRFEYGEDMIDSGKWGKEITSEIGKTMKIKGSRGRDEVVIVPKDELLKGGEDSGRSPLQDGDIIFFIKSPEKRVVGEIVGHIGIITIKDGVPYLIHASGRKESDVYRGGGSVISVPLHEYLENTRFIGVRVTRFRQ